MDALIFFVTLCCLGMAIMVERRKVTPPVLAKEWGVATKKVVDLIKSGELRAINLASTQDKRPRYAIDRADIEAFEAARVVVPEVKPIRRKRSVTGPSGKDHFAHI